MNIETIYIEKEIKDHPNTKNILKKINYKNIILCNKYTEIFNTKNQNFRVQKINPGLILAQKKKNFLLKTPENFTIGYTNNYYFSHMLNCIYDCKYCFLQGMFASANYLIFVNYKDFFNPITKILKNSREKVCFFSGYDCDSLAFEKVTNFVENFLNFFEKIENGILEIRTKSPNIQVFKKRKPLDNVIVAYSLNPNEIIKEFEPKTSNLKIRLKCLKILQQMNWKIGLRFDPIINVDGNFNLYKHFFKIIFSELDPKKIHSVTLGKFRMPRRFYNKFINLRQEDSFVFNKLNNSDENNINKLHEYEFELLKHLEPNKIFSN